MSHKCALLLFFAVVSVLPGDTVESAAPDTGASKYAAAASERKADDGGEAVTPVRSHLQPSKVCCCGGGGGGAAYKKSQSLEAILSVGHAPEPVFVDAQRFVVRDDIVCRFHVVNTSPDIVLPASKLTAGALLMVLLSYRSPLVSSVLRVL